MNRDTNYYPSPMVAYAQVGQGLSPVLGANVTAIIEPENGDPIILELFDNGAGNKDFVTHLKNVIKQT